MGYTHYFNHRRAFTKGEWATVCEDLSAIIAVATAEGVAIGDRMGEVKMGTLDVTDSTAGAAAFFNGFGEEAYETFAIWQKRPPLQPWESAKDRGQVFCKTERKPYDVAVTAALIYLESYFPAHFHVSSDGKPDDWQDGLALARRALPRLHNVLRVPPHIEFDALFSRNHFSGAGYSLSSMQDSTLCIADWNALGIVGRFESPESIEWVKGWAERVAKERRAMLPARLDVLERWQARKMRTLVQSAESFGYLKAAARLPEHA